MNSLIGTKITVWHSKLLRVALVTAMALTVSLGAACSPAADKPSDDAAAAGAKYTLTFAGVGADSTSIDSIAVAYKKGWFAEEGIDIKDAGSIAIPEYVPAILSGSISGARLMTSNGIAANDNGADLIAVGAMSNTTQERPHMQFVVAKDSPIQSAKDLEGKKIAVPALDGCNSGFPLEYLKQGGVQDPIKAIDFVTTPPDGTVAALERGEVDVAGLHTALDQTPKLYPNVRVLFTDYDILGEKGGDITYWFPRKFVDENTELIKAFLKVVAKTNNWINDNSAEALEYYKTEVNPLANAELLSAAHYTKDALIDESHVQLWIDLLAQGNSFQEALKTVPAIDSLYTNKYNPNFTG